MERRHFLTTSIVATAISFLFTAPESRAQAHTKGRPVAATSPTLKPGDYAWYRMPSIGAGVVVMKTQSSHRKIYCRATHASRRWPSCTSSQSLRIASLSQSIENMILIAGLCPCARERLTTSAVNGLQNDAVLRSNLRYGAIKDSRAICSLTELPRDLRREPSITRLTHQAQRLLDALVGYETEEW